MMRMFHVDCLRDGKVIASYPYPSPVPIKPGIPPSHTELKEQAKSSLTDQRLAFPPYDDITFNVREG